MSDKKIKLAITHGDINGVGYEVIIKTFSDNRMMEMCTPILYGSSKIASYHKKLLPKQELNFTNVKDAKSSMDKKFNVVNIIDDDIIYCEEWVKKFYSLFLFYKYNFGGIPLLKSYLLMIK